MTTTPTPRVDVIVLNYNGRDFLEACLAGLEGQSYRDFSITVVDNGSRDGAVAWLRSDRPDVNTVALPSNVGFAAAYDQQIRTGASELVAMLNNDAVPDAGWLGALVAALDADLGVAAVTSRIRFMADAATLNHAGAALSPLGSGYDIGFGEPDGTSFETPRDCGAPSGAACLIRRADFINVGGFDRRYFAWFEDVDLGWRLWLRGRRVRYTPDATVRHHYGAAGGGRRSTLRLYHCQKNRLANATKHLSLPRLTLALVAGLGYDTARVIAAFRERQGLAVSWAIARGDLAYLAWLPLLIRERRRIQRERRLGDSELRAAGALTGWRDALRAYRVAERYRAKPE